MIHLFSMMQLAIWDWMNYQSKVDLIHGAICRMNHYWNSWIGSLHRSTRPLNIQTQKCCHQPRLPQVMSGDIGTKIPRSNVFRFENFWAERSDFINIVQQSQISTVAGPDAAKNMSYKFKMLRSSLKNWSKHLSNQKQLIDNCNSVIQLLDALEDQRGLYNLEANLRILVKRQLQTWLQYRNIYWKNRYNVNRIWFGDECTNSFMEWTQSPIEEILFHRLKMSKECGLVIMKAKQDYYGPLSTKEWA